MHRFDCRGILFDLDGVLVDSTALIEKQWSEWARSRGLDPEPFLRVCHGRRALETIRLAAPDLDAEAEIAAFLPEDTVSPGLVKPIEGAKQLLEALPARSWAVATSGPRRAAIERLQVAGLPVPAVMVCAEDVVHGKPSPDVYLLAAAELGVAPEACVVVEDSAPGIEAARRAGAAVIGLTTTHPPGELAADAWTGTLAGIRLGRVEIHPREAPLIELLVIP